MLAGLSTGGLADPGRNEDFILGARVPTRWVTSDPCLLNGDLAEDGVQWGSSKAVQEVEEVKIEALETEDKEMYAYVLAEEPTGLGGDEL